MSEFATDDLNHAEEGTKKARGSKKAKANGSTAPKEPIATLEEFKAKAERGFRMTSKGLMWSDPSDDEKPEITISGPFEIKAQCRDDKGDSWGRLLRWQDADEKWHEWAMPVSQLAGDGLDVRRSLLDGGLYVSPNSKARVLLTTYLAGTHVKARARAVSSTGWYGNIFVFPDGAIGTVDGGEIVILKTAHHIDHSYNVRGTLEEWQENVGRFAQGNSRLTLAISMACAATLVGPCGIESGGINYRGISSIGKTTALFVAGSVFGGCGPDGFTKTWRATANGLEGTAVIHTDALLCLDELSQFKWKRGWRGCLYAGQPARQRAHVTRCRPTQTAVMETPFLIYRRDWLG